MVSEKTLNSDILGSYVHYYSFVRLWLLFVISLLIDLLYFF
jgi:hypothetical protein